MKFPDKNRHQIFIEPEGLYTNEMYLSGMSSSMPEDVQYKMYHSMKGFEHINVSIGVAATGAPKLRYQVLLTQVEAALKNAKAHGKNNYRVYFEEEKL